ncbi:putative ran binding family protein 1 [Toxoplasma gondii RUB]|uniref:Putative ran binding family protein 1 n=4 Tax=Toxoplasma gondii TaxID=5811 RepID=A0A2G8XRP4_TOXGO|nr:putative ran binding family protein 1 [Toxoplasma gondii GAB2-2007-GAL-DOM2]KFG59434.1 putative ran binding family protein 1 [Toxoplasma gondii RUB]KFH03228.1 putative ran binding family protein 1 [Toxoplasma gondii VAND]PIL97682.1 putative ran binding family protein 1 [Toxoplasma gondii COUG]
MSDAATEPKPAQPAEATQATKEEEDNFNPEEEVTEGNWNTPQVEVHAVQVETGEEDEDVFWKHRSKLYRWVSSTGDAQAAGEWKERGIGDAKLLRHKETGKIRFLLRQEKTLKIVANHYVVASGVYCKLTPNVSSEKIWVWTVMDFAEGELKNEQFALKFGQVEQAQEFKKKFEEAAALNAKIFGVEAEGEEKTEKGEKKEKEEEKKEKEEK